MKYLIILLILSFPLTALSHVNEEHENKSSSQKMETSMNSETTNEKAVISTQQDQSNFETINNEYVSDIKNIFANKCNDCHGNKTNYPWYYKIPLVKQMIESDIENAKKHLDISAGFPFAGHGEPLDDLKSLQEVFEDESMPPFLYVLAHPESRLTEMEKTKVISWIEKSKLLIE